MPVIGLNLKTIEAKKHEEIKGPLRVNSNMNVTNVREQDLPALNDKGLSIDFDFKTKYIGERVFFLPFQWIRNRIKGYRLFTEDCSNFKEPTCLTSYTCAPGCTNK